MSPSASAPRIASVSACSATSASEWPAELAIVRNLRRRRARHGRRRRRRRARRSRCRCGRRQAPACASRSVRAKSSGVVIFMLPLLALEYRDTQAGPFGQRGIVGKILAAFAGSAAMRIEQGRVGERLRRLHGAQRGAVERGGDTRSSSSTSFTVSVTGRPGTAAPLVRRGRDGAADQRRRGERPRGVVHQHDRGRGFRAAPPARPAPKPAASRRPARAAQIEPCGGGGKTGGIVGMDHRLDQVDFADARANTRRLARIIGCAANPLYCLGNRARHACPRPAATTTAATRIAMDRPRIASVEPRL